MLEIELSAIKELILRNTDSSNEEAGNNCLELKQTNRACGLAGYDVAFTRRRSGVRIAPSPLFFSRLNTRLCVQPTQNRVIILTEVDAYGYEKRTDMRIDSSDVDALCAECRRSIDKQTSNSDS